MLNNTVNNLSDVCNIFKCHKLVGIPANGWFHLKLKNLICTVL